MIVGSDGELPIPASSAVARRNHPRSTVCCDTNLGCSTDLGIKYIFSLQYCQLVMVSIRNPADGLLWEVVETSGRAK